MRYFNRLKHLSKQFIYHIFPYCDYIFKSKKVLARIKKIDDGNYGNNLKYVERLDGFKEADILSFFEHTLERKKSLEEKSRSILLTVTVAITLIIGLITILFNQDKFANGSKFVTYSIFVIGLVSVLYMITGAVMSLKLLSCRIQVYQLFPTDMALEEAERIRLIAINTEQNTNMNTIRNNMIYIAYKSIINSLVCLLILFLLLSINLIANDHNKINDYKKLKEENAQLSSEVRLYELASKNDTISIRKRIFELDDKIDSLKSGIEKIESSQRKK